MEELPESEFPARPGPSQTRFWGCCSRKERWGFSARGWVLLTVSSGLGMIGLLLGIHPFLAVTDRVEADVLVVEGWVHRYAITAALQEFTNGHYPRIYTTGGPVTGDGGYTGDANTSASVGAGLLRQAGLPSTVVQRVPSRVIGRDRTYHAALALRAWFQEHRLSVSSINVLTESAHARRTRLLFQKAFGDGARIGIIAVSNPDYDARRWWRYSEGVREVLGESIAYLYARFFFHPDHSETGVLNQALGRSARLACLDLRDGPRTDLLEPAFSRAAR